MWLTHNLSSTRCRVTTHLTHLQLAIGNLLCLSDLVKTLRGSLVTQLTSELATQLPCQTVLRTKTREETTGFSSVISCNRILRSQQPKTTSSFQVTLATSAKTRRSRVTLSLSKDQTLRATE